MVTIAYPIRVSPIRGYSTMRLSIGSKSLPSPNPGNPDPFLAHSAMSAQRFQVQPSHFSGSTIYVPRRSTNCQLKIFFFFLRSFRWNTYLRFGGRVLHIAQHVQCNVVFMAHDIVGDCEDTSRRNLEACFLEGFTLGTRMNGFAKIQVPARRRPCT